MWPWLKNAMGLLTLGALLAFGWAFYQVGSAVKENREDLHVAVNGARDAMDSKGSGIPTLFNEARDVTIALLKKCKAGHPESCGLIPAVQQVALDAGAATLAVKTEVENTQPLIVNAANAMSTAAGDITETSKHVNKAVDAGTGTLNQATSDLGTLNTSIAASKPLLDAFTASGEHLNKILGGPQVTGTLTAVQTSSENVAAISGDVKTIADGVAKPTPKKGADLVFYVIKSLMPAWF